MNWEVFVSILYFIAMLGIGIVFFFRSKSKTDKDFFLGGKSMGPWVSAMSAQASDMSAGCSWVCPEAFWHSVLVRLG